MNAVAVQDVSLTFAPVRGGEPVHALDGVSLRANAGEVVAVVGPSGCGKTTLLELICGLLQADSGTVEAPGAALMAQRDLLLPWLSALDNAGLALRVGPGPVPLDQPRVTGAAAASGEIGTVRPLGRGAARAEAEPWFERLGLAGFEQATPSELSGGMRQRVAFLRTLLSGKPVLCLDEPFGALDALTRAEMQRWLDRVLAAERALGDARTVVLVTHDVEEAVLLADRVLVLSARPGRVVLSLEIELPHPRVATDAAVVALRAQVLEALGAPR